MKYVLKNHNSGRLIPYIVESVSNNTTTSIQCEEVVYTKTEITSSNSDEAGSDGNEFSNKGLVVSFSEA